LADPTAHPITLSNGWTWIGYLSANAMNPTEALVSITPSENDQIKSQTGFATYTTANGWTGMETMEPGQGYIYLHNGNDAMTLVYPATSKGNVVVTPKETYWKGNHHAFATNLTMIVTLDENQLAVRKGSHEVGAFVNGECRGSARIEEVNGSYVAFLTVSGEAGEEVTFRLYDVTTGSEYAKVASERISYKANDVYGTLSEPMRLHFGVTGVNEGEDTLSVYPNPTSDKVMVKGNGIETMKVYNAMGQLLHMEECGNAEQVELSLGGYSAGVYTVSVKLGNGQTVNSMIVKQ
jgi:hypothetical protein